MEAFDGNRLESALLRLAPWKPVVFMLLAAERMLPNYQRFSVETGFGDISVLRESLDAAWAWVETGEFPGNLAALRVACEEQAPDTENFQSSCTSAALDAASATATILDMIENPNGTRLAEVAALARDTVDLYLHDVLRANLRVVDIETAVAQHFLMQRELRRQSEDLAALEKWSADRRAAARAFKTSAGSDSGGSLDA